MKLRLVLNVEYDPKGVPQEDLIYNLHRMIHYGVGEGFLNGYTPAELITWNCSVVPVNKPSTRG